MDSSSMSGIAKALAAMDLRVARFEFDYMAERRRSGARKPPPRAELLQEEFDAALAACERAGTVIIGGKSMGGRVASMIADRHHAAGSIAGLLCLGYPFHPIGKPDRLRTQHLADIGTPTLIVQGTRDPFGSSEDVATYALGPAIEMLWLADGDHDFRPRKHLSGFTLADHLQNTAHAVSAWVAKVA